MRPLRISRTSYIANNKDSITLDFYLSHGMIRLPGCDQANASGGSPWHQHAVVHGGYDVKSRNGFVVSLFEDTEDDMAVLAGLGRLFKI